MTQQMFVTSGCISALLDAVGVADKNRNSGRANERLAGTPKILSLTHWLCQYYSCFHDLNITEHRPWVDKMMALLNWPLSWDLCT